ncbi:barstar family protein [Pseudoxanthomonas sp. YR558]|nr:MULTISPECIES: barstar family protein [unclassified Pseudoxanthomonas]SFV33497.1 Barstar (barnase inhibitor) [Pseudoxanthomonas sp. YR558]
MRIDANSIVDVESFHSVFTTAFGFPSFYGRNMDAWIDCLSYLDDPSSGMTTVHVDSGQMLSLVIDHAQDFKLRQPDLFSALVECAAFVNWRRVEAGQAPVLALAFHA